MNEQFVMAYLDPIKKDAYTGEQRCAPCTAVNIVIGTITSVAIGSVRPVLGFGAFVASLAIIYFRGYLIPGTPTLTQRYFPDRVLRWFGKGSLSGSTTSIAGESTKRLLRETGVVATDDEQHADVTPAFREAWRDRVRIVRSEALEDVFAEVLDVQRESVTVDDAGESIAVFAGEVVIGPWDSRAAAVADIAAWYELEELSPAYRQLGVDEMMDLLDGLRAFVDRCPECDGPVTKEETVIESCCDSITVIRSSCDDCGARLVNAPVESDGSE